MRSALLLLSVCALILSRVIARTARYRSGYLDGDFLEKLTATVKDAREYCKHTSSCISFSFVSPTRFPEGDVTCYFFAFSDWHVNSNGESLFREDPSWHSYVNITRERDAVPREVKTVIERLRSMSNLRGGGSVEKKVTLLDSLFNIVIPKENKKLASSLIAPVALDFSSSKTEDDSVKLSAMRLLIVLGDSSETGNILFDAGVYHVMKKIINSRDNVWNEISRSALDVISNMCLYRSANDKLRSAGAANFLQGILRDPGFPGLQATLALTHLGDHDFEHAEFPMAKIYLLTDLLQNAIDGDVTYGIKWDLIPGPLSAIKYLVMHANQRSSVYRHLLDANIIQRLLQVLETDCMDPSETEAALQILLRLATVSERARHMILFMEHTIQQTEIQLRKYTEAAGLARSLSATVASYDSSRSEL